MRKCKKIPTALLVKAMTEIISLLHASRDGMRNIKKHDTKVVSFAMQGDGGYSAEAFGILRGLRLMGYGYFGSVNLDGLQERNGGVQQESNLKWWFAQLEQQVLQEEGFYNHTHRCDHCIEKYRKDDSRVRSLNGEIMDKNPKIPTDVQIIYPMEAGNF